MSFKMRNLMKIVLLLTGVALSAGSALADGVPGTDPRIAIGGGSASKDLTEPTFSFTSNSRGGGPVDNYDFYNDSGETFFNLSVTTPDPYPSLPLSDFQCDVYAYFSPCIPIRNSLEGTITFYFPSVDGGGVPPCEDGDASYCEFRFSLNTDGSFGNPAGPGGWKDNEPFSGVANTPEPGTITLFVTSLGILAAKGKFRRRSSSGA